MYQLPRYGPFRNSEKSIIILWSFYVVVYFFNISAIIYKDKKYQFKYNK